MSSTGNSIQLMPASAGSGYDKIVTYTSTSKNEIISNITLTDDVIFMNDNTMLSGVTLSDSVIIFANPRPLGNESDSGDIPYSLTGQGPDDKIHITNCSFSGVTIRPLGANYIEIDNNSWFRNWHNWGGIENYASSTDSFSVRNSKWGNTNGMGAGDHAAIMCYGFGGDKKGSVNIHHNTFRECVRGVLIETGAEEYRTWSSGNVAPELKINDNVFGGRLTSPIDANRPEMILFHSTSGQLDMSRIEILRNQWDKRREAVVSGFASDPTASVAQNVGTSVTFWNTIVPDCQIDIYENHQVLDSGSKLQFAVYSDDEDRNPNINITLNAYDISGSISPSDPNWLSIFEQGDNHLVTYKRNPRTTALINTGTSNTNSDRIVGTNIIKGRRGDPKFNHETNATRVASPPSGYTAEGHPTFGDGQTSTQVSFGTDITNANKVRTTYFRPSGPVNQTL